MRSNRQAAIVVLLLAWPGARAAVAAPVEQSEPAPAGATEPASAASERDASADVLRVKVDPMLADAALLPGWITERHPDLARSVRDPEGRHAQWIAVEISGSTYDFRVSVSAVRDGEPLGASAEPTRCECTTGELLALVDVGIAAAVDRLRTAPPGEPTPEPAAEPAAIAVAPRPRAEPLAPQPRSLLPDARSRGLGPLGHAGIGVTVAGVGLTAVGAVLARRPEQIRGAPGDVETRDVRSAGLGLAVTGGVVLATGLGLLVADLAAPRRRTIALVPTLHPGMAGAVLVRRF